MNRLPGSGLIRKSQDHLGAVGEDYGRHRRFAFGVGGSMIVGGLACIIHGLIPALFTDKASRTIDRLHGLIRNRETLDAGARRELSPLHVLTGLCIACAILPWAAGAQALIALPLSILSLSFVAAYGWSEEGQGDPLELLVPIRLD